MERFIRIVLLLSVPSAVCAAELETILQQNAEAHGGTAISQVQAIKVELRITEPTFEVMGHYTATRDGLMRIDIFAGQDRVFAEGLTHKCAWEWSPGQPGEDLGACVGETETAALRHGIEMPGNFYTLADVRDRGAEIELIGETKSNIGLEWQLRVTLPDGFTRDYFLDQESYRLTRSRDRRAFHPGVDPAKVNIETRFEDPEYVDGVLRFNRQVSVNIDTGEVLGTTQVLSATHNPQVNDEMFAAGWVPQ